MIFKMRYNVFNYRYFDFTEALGTFETYLNQQ